MVNPQFQSVSSDTETDMKTLLLGCSDAKEFGDQNGSYEVIGKWIPGSIDYQEI